MSSSSPSKGLNTTTTISTTTASLNHSHATATATAAASSPALSAGTTATASSLSSVATTASTNTAPLSNHNSNHHPRLSPHKKTLTGPSSSSSSSSWWSALWAFKDELLASVDVLFQSKFTWLLVLGPLAIVGDMTQSMGEAACFCFSGIALIPCAERLSFITEQVAEHTNGTIGALLNATFGNAPELLISVAALRAGYYRVVQLAMLGSMLTNMILVFGISCVIGGLRWQVQELRITSGNVPVVMLLVATAGSLFPAALKLSGQYNLHHQGQYPDDTSSSTGGKHISSGASSSQSAVQGTSSDDDDDFVTPAELAFCRVNAVVMLLLYLCFLLFQLGTHKEEYDEDDIGYRAKRARRNLLFSALWERIKRRIVPIQYHTALWGQSNIAPSTTSPHEDGIDHEDVPLILRTNNSMGLDATSAHSLQDKGGIGATDLDYSERSFQSDTVDLDMAATSAVQTKRRRRGKGGSSNLSNHHHSSSSHRAPRHGITSRNYEKSKNSDSTLIATDLEHGRGDILFDDQEAGDETNHNSEHVDDDDDDQSHSHLHPVHAKSAPVISMRVGIVWLFIITVCISAMSDILVDTIDGFARRLRLSEVFTSMVIIPFFSNVAEQVSAFLFAYRNEMDLCVGVTVGSAIQIATFVLPGSVVIGYFMDRSMTLYFHGYETVCLFFAVVVVGAILQGGTTNWMTGVMLVGIYVMLASGIWFHELENLTMNGEDTQETSHVASHNATRTLYHGM